MKTSKSAPVWLCIPDMALLARFPITHGRVPMPLSPSGWKAFYKLVEKRVIVGVPGGWSVRWGVLTKKQYETIEMMRRWPLAALIGK